MNDKRPTMKALLSSLVVWRLWLAMRVSVPKQPQPAIPARHIPLVEGLIYWPLVRLPTWSFFSRVWLKVEGPLPHPADGPLIVYLNHPSWWDGYVAFWLHRAVFRRRFQPLLMMDERQLRSFRFFSWIGVFSVNLRDSGKGALSVNYAVEQLRLRRDRVLFIFPQGTITPNDRRPLKTYSGTARIATQLDGVTLWPVAVRYEFRGEQRPEAFVRCGPPHYVAPNSDRAALNAEINARLAAAADALRDEVNDERLDDYRVLMRGRAGIDKLFAGLLKLFKRH